ncbi:hypothetical protein [Methylocystis iwaonis]|uniref:hypothetical protein n=1 Tax=Methylocystis iwaonis TaxID=2885079 RepID=UPI002E7B5E04|nr:hypothetical protein [Methylocystis iwaonis]
MSVAERLETCARDWLAFAETSEAKLLGVRREEARPLLAARMQEAPGTLENLFRGRLKGLPATLYEKARREYIRAAEREIRKLENDLAIARAGHSDADFIDACEIEAHLTALRAIVERRKKVKRAT